MEKDDLSLCVLDNARKAARAVSRHYDRLARRSGITAAQFSVLSAIARTDRRTTGELADRLSMERTTLVRNVALLERKGLVRSSVSGEARGKCHRLTERGAALLEEAMPLWRQAQNDVREHLGSEEFIKTINALKRLSQI
ncbi:MarR family winged helix-turn-helix transcriptional regulator [Roseibium marinum]|uniref:DNA-binding MarR family transcriptional regulator n=1 Tax=Roseibium marinum TaxID=281252 RepID=A0A2S3UX15_9HYPH|nr:MarR family winged helix-turn-helix transcriptional regulator [Roseibium marinum]POF32258.1 DNA-binding MarR family transcriptional regulator [Roseibium marinum]